MSDLNAHESPSDSNYSVYVGVDQTGAVTRKQVPRPLPACLIRGRKVSFHYLNSFSRTEFEKIIPDISVARPLICVDCVFGLPQKLSHSWLKVMQLIKKSDGYGRKPAENFFKQLGGGQILRRKIEIALGGNSVFQEKPFQKNIQTGSYRIWKDISQKSEDFYLPALELRKSHRQLTIVEGYPTYSWKILFAVSKRSPSQLHSLVKQHRLTLNWNPKLQKAVAKDPNLADAFILALMAKKFKRSISSLNPQKEGSILGYSLSK